MPRIIREHEQIDLLVAHIVSVRHGSTPQYLLELVLDGREEGFAFQGLPPELDDELIVHRQVQHLDRPALHNGVSFNTDTHPDARCAGATLRMAVRPIHASSTESTTVVDHAQAPGSRSTPH